MSRHFDNFLDAYVDYSNYTEAPDHIHYWVGVTLIAALLGRRVWWDKKAFKVFPNFYLMLVGPPDVIKKSTTLSQGVQLLRQLEDFHLGPSTLTWQALIKAFKEAETTEETYPGVYEEMSNMFIASGEMGSFLNPEDRQCMDMLVKLWDGEGVDKVTIGAGGSFQIDNPLLSFATCTTPAWIRQSIPPYMIDGGLLSRIIAIYAEKRKRRIALPELAAPANFDAMQQMLVDDLEDIRLLKGDIIVTKECIPVIEEQYDRICDAQEKGDAGLLRRKQTQIFKLSMILAAATNSQHQRHLLLTPDLLMQAEERINYIEEQRKIVFKLVGKNRQAMLANVISEVLGMKGELSARELYREMFDDMPNKEEFQGLLFSMEKAGLIVMRKPEQTTFVSLKAERKSNVAEEL